MYFIITYNLLNIYIYKYNLNNLKVILRNTKCIAYNAFWMSKKKLCLKRAYKY